LDQAATSPGRGCGLRGSPHLSNGISVTFLTQYLKEERFQLSLE